MSIDYENPDFSALVDMAMEGRPGPLQHALRLLSAKLRRPLEDADYPECVHMMFKAFAPFAQPNGMPKRGRPLKDAGQERMRQVYSKWVESLVRDAYEEKRLLLQIAKENGGGEIIDGERAPIHQKPSDRAREIIAEEFGNFDKFGDAKPDAFKKMLRGKVSKKGTPR